MTDLCLQVQPDRAPSIDLSAVRRICAEIGAFAFVERFKQIDGEDDGRYVNFMFATAEPARLWAELRRALLEDERLGPNLARCAMTMCEGSDGWNDYLLLSHFDPDQPLDRFP